MEQNPASQSETSPPVQSISTTQPVAPPPKPSHTRLYILISIFMLLLIGSVSGFIS